MRDNGAATKRAAAAVIAAVLGSLAAWLLLWLFAIDVSHPSRLLDFPEGWTLRQFVYDAAALLVWGGAVRAVYMGLSKYWGLRPASGPVDGPTAGDEGGVG